MLVVQFWNGDDTPSDGGTGRTGGELAMSLDPLSSDSGLAPSSALFGTERIVVKHLFTGLAEGLQMDYEGHPTLATAAFK